MGRMLGEAIPLHVAMLGSFEVRAGDRVVIDETFVPRKAKSIVKFLALQPGHRASTEQVIDLLWPDVSRDTGASSLYKTTHLLRSRTNSFGQPDLIQTRKNQISLSSPLTVDVEEFRAAASKAIRQGTDPSLYLHAIRLCTGDIIPQGGYEDWLEGPRNDLKSLCHRLHLSLASLYERNHEFGAALEQLQHVLIDDQSNEAAHLMAMRIYLAVGQPDRALRQYDICRAALKRELGIGPSREVESAARAAHAPERSGGRRGGLSSILRQPATVMPAVLHTRTPDGARIAYMAAGSGPPLVRTSSISGSHLIARRLSPRVQASLDLLETEYTIVQYDGRGSGLSQRKPCDFSLEKRVLDLESVVDTVGMDRFVLWGAWSGGPTAIAYAVKHPERVSGLVLDHCYYRGRDWYDLAPVRAYASLRPTSAAEWDFYALAQANWERRFYGDVVNADEPVEQRANLLRESLDPDALNEFRSVSREIDLSDALRLIRVRTLVLCRPSPDYGQPKYSEDLARNIPGAQLFVIGPRREPNVDVEWVHAMRGFLERRIADGRLPAVNDP